ncbi:MAG: baseplate J/gp47 family protein [Ruminococcus sp.]|nr:baseplate J/gp47 family protein [Ruminococcus sp.]
MITYDEIYNRMLNDYNTRTNNYPSDSSDVAIRLKVLAGEIFSSYMNLEFIKKQMFLTTATGEYIDYHGSQRGLTRKSATKATGTVDFRTSAPSQSSIFIPKGTIVSTAGENPVLFETSADTTLLAGQSKVTSSCIALKGGSSGNVRVNAISVIVTPISGITSVLNTVAFTGGADEESDEEFKQRIEDTIINVSNGANEAYYKKLALSVEGVEGVGIIPQNRGVGTVDIFICAKGATANSALVQKVQSLIDEYKEINTDVLVQSARVWNFPVSLSVSLKPGYDFNVVKTNLTNNLKEFVSSLGVGKSVYEADLADIIYHTDGVDRYFLSFSDSTVAQDQFANLTTVTITERSS